jgi:hypothetical protein
MGSKKDEHLKNRDEEAPIISRHKTAIIIIILLICIALTLFN